MRGILLFCVLLIRADPGEHLYTFQEFYTDAQYGPDFGYYFTGRILHDVAGDSLGEELAAESFNSYTTMPMSMSPYFGALLADRICGMWLSLGRPSPFFLFEFGGGTGVLARDILRRLRSAHPDLYAALGAYILGERSRALRAAQRQTASEFVQDKTLHIIAADAREASADVRELALEIANGRGGGDGLDGIVVTNELLDELDPVKLRVFWRQGSPPAQEALGGEDCGLYRENFILHRVKQTKLEELISSSSAEASGFFGSLNASGADALRSLRWEHSSIPCEILESSASSGTYVQRLSGLLVDKLSADEAKECLPFAVCCLPLLLATTELATSENFWNESEVPSSDGQIAELLRAYRQAATRTRGTFFLAKRRYQQLRRLVGYGTATEASLLYASSEDRIHTDELYLRLPARRCEELRGWRQRHAEQLAKATAIHDAVSVFRGAGADRMLHLKLTLRPGEADFVDQMSRLIDRGFLLTMDYGADFEALLWLALVRPHFEGLHIMDARQEFADECTRASYLQCPGLQDITTSVDFTEVAEAGRGVGWEVRAYGPIFLLERAFDASSPRPLVHLLERAGGLRTAGVKGWYQKAEHEPWASFKVLVQAKVGAPELRSDWALPGADWPLVQDSFFVPALQCWELDASRPPFAAMLAAKALAAMERGGDANVSGKAGHLAEIVAADRAGAAVATAEDWRQMFPQIMTRPELLEDLHVKQQHAYADMHLAMLLTDYWRYALEADSPEIQRAGACGESPRRWPPRSWRNRVQEAMELVRGLAETRLLHHIYGEDTLVRVFDDLTTRFQIFGGANASWPDRARRSQGPELTAAPPHVCLAASIMRAHCRELAPG